MDVYVLSMYRSPQITRRNNTEKYVIEAESKLNTPPFLNTIKNNMKNI